MSVSLTKRVSLEKAHVITEVDGELIDVAAYGKPTAHKLIRSWRALGMGVELPTATITHIRHGAGITSTIVIPN